MMTIFTRQTVGVYVSLTFVGAGVGLLVGSYVAAFIEQRRVNKLLDELDSAVSREERDNLVRQLGYFNDELDTELEEYDNVKLVDETNQTDEIGKEAAESESTPVYSRSGRSGKRTGTSGSGRSTGTDGRPRTDYSGRSRTPQSAPEAAEATSEEANPSIELGRDERNRFAKLAARYSITPLQKQLFESGLIDLDELEAGLEYEAPWDDKPDLDELVDDEEILIDSNFEVLSDLPSGVHSITELGYFEETDTMVRVMRDGRYARVNDPDELLGDGTLDTVLEVLAYAPSVPVYVSDLSNQKIYSISILEEEAVPTKKKRVRSTGSLDDASG